MTTIAFVGLGTMGRHMAGHLVARGFAVRGHDRVPGAAASVPGVVAADSIAAAAQGADVAITMLPDTPDVEAVVLGAGGLAGTLAAGSLVIDMSTMSPVAARAIHAALAARGIGFVDAPVSGGAAGGGGGGADHHGGRIGRRLRAGGAAVRSPGPGGDACGAAGRRADGEAVQPGGGGQQPAIGVRDARAGPRRRAWTWRRCARC